LVFGVAVILHRVPLLFGWLCCPLLFLCCCGFGGVVGWLVWSCNYIGLVCGWVGLFIACYGWDRGGIAKEVSRFNKWLC